MKVVEAHGARIPGLGFGPGGLRGERGTAIIAEALAAGYRHLDTARSYGNEREVGEAVRSSGIARDEVFVTTKVWPDRLRAADLRRSAEESAGALGLGPVDLFLIHWPNPSVPLRETLAALAAVKREGLARHVGLSNFSRALLARAWEALSSWTAAGTESGRGPHALGTGDEGGAPRPAGLRGRSGLRQRG